MPFKSEVIFSFGLGLNKCSLQSNLNSLFMGRALLFACVSQMSKLRCSWLQSHQDEKTQSGDVLDSLRFFTLQSCDVGKYLMLLQKQ